MGNIMFVGRFKKSQKIVSSASAFLNVDTCPSYSDLKFIIARSR